MLTDTLCLFSGMEIQDGGILTGSSYNFGCISDRNVIVSASTIFSRVANAMEHRPTQNNAGVYTKSNMVTAKPEVVTTAAVR
jgi:hypothetical protein